MVPLLEVRNLQITFTRYTGGLRQHQIKVVDGVDLSVAAGEITAIIGASGSGKSLLAHAILGLLPGNAAMSGKIMYRGEELDARRQEALRGREIAYIPQAVTYLDPTMRVGRQVRLAAGGDRREAADKQRRAFRRYRLGEHVEKLYPFELSGGMARRVLVAAASVSDARLIIADEPTPGLPQAEVREALLQLRELADSGCGVLLITHDIQAALGVADRVVVFYAGSSVETAHAQDFSGDGHLLRHPYSRALWRALPENGFEVLPGAQPQPSDRLEGCLFAPRCAMATAACSKERPEMRHVRGGMVRCYHAT
jgi:oligopeptide/dipeptide ABC transporter, ATP-binding protein, C-terminal domain